MTKSAGTISRSIIITGAPPVQLLDVAGPLEVFSNVRGYDVVVVTTDGSTELKTNRGIYLSGTVPPREYLWCNRHANRCRRPGRRKRQLRGGLSPLDFGCGT
jgi:hypothetical protein